MGLAPRAMVSVVSVSIEISYLVTSSVTPQKGQEGVMVFYFQNYSEQLWEKKCSINLEKLLILKPECREFAKFLRSLNRTIYLKSQRSVQFLKQDAFLTSSSY